MSNSRVSRRSFLKFSVPGLLGLAGTGVLTARAARQSRAEGTHPSHLMAQHASGSIDPAEPPGMNPAKFLAHFDYGKVSKLPDGRALREYRVTAVDREVVVARGVSFPAWTLNGYVPGPTLRATQGDRLRVHFQNRSAHPHTLHFHGIHPAHMDGVFELVPPGGTFTYEFDAEPYGIHLYHCHAMPLKAHIMKGLYGTFIIDPKEGRPPAREMVMVMNGFDTNLDGENEFYTVNGVANYYRDHPIPIRQNEPVRVYLVNLTEFDPINSMHIHANFFRLYRTGTRMDQYEYTDTVMLCQGERCILEFAYSHPGKFMFHAHQSEFAELGWMGFFDVQPEKPLA
ncbi:MAG: multicopper oxidase domain-containing protein [Candidatus Tectomicrobia bacterium]|nr:multicopper oxidase domain-containing protein [Candidatus Tectomicrobia bacterium]